MPQPYVGAVKYGPNTDTERPELAIGIGNVCANWNLLEEDLLRLYALLMGDYLQKDPEYAPPFHPVAYQVFDTINSFNAKLSLLLNLLKWRVSQEIVDKFNAINLKKRHDERSLIAHGIWGISDQHNDALILVQRYRKNYTYKKRDFDDVANRIIQDRVALGNITNELYQEREKRPPRR